VATRVCVVGSWSRDTVKSTLLVEAFEALSNLRGAVPHCEAVHDGSTVPTHQRATDGKGSTL